MVKLALFFGGLALLSASAVMATNTHDDLACSGTIPVDKAAWSGERWGMQVYKVNNGKQEPLGNVQTIIFEGSEPHATLILPLHNCTENTYYKIAYGKVSKLSENHKINYGFFYSQCYKIMQKTPQEDFVFGKFGNETHKENPQFIYSGDEPANCN
ncbi:hypothetical protein BH10PSE19_BH10PSE19_21980 [soil metagenome]